MTAVSDDFNRADSASLGANWTEAAGDGEISTNRLRLKTGGFANNIMIYSGSALSSVDQYVKVVSATADFYYPLAIFRYTNSSSAFYGMSITGNTGDVDWVYFTDTSDSGTSITTGSLGAAIGNGDNVSLTCVGTGTSTVIRGWRNTTADAPSSDGTTWDGNAAAFTLTTDPGSPVNSGSYVGVGGVQSAADFLVFQDFYGGDVGGGGVSISAGLGQATLTGLAPSLAATEHQFVTPGLGEAVITGFAPTLAATGDVAVSADLGQLAFTGLAPTLAATEHQFAAPSLGQLEFTGLAPTVSATGNVAIESSVGELTFTGYEPSQTLTLPSPNPGALVLAGHVPTVEVTVPGAVTTGLGELVISGYVPTVSATGHVFVSPSLGTIDLTGLVPSLALTENVFVTPDVGQATLTGLAPGIAATENQFAAPSVGELTFDGYAPSLSQDGSFSAAPEVGILELLGLVPSVLNSGDRSRTRVGPKRRNYIYKGKRYHNLTQDELMRLIAADAIDITREDIKVVYKGKKPHKIANNAWAELQATIKSLDSILPPEPQDDDEDIEKILMLL